MILPRGLPRGLTRRVLLASSLGVCVGGVGMFFAAAQTAATFAVRRGYVLNSDVREHRIAQCLADPTGWDMNREGHLGYAYDASTRRSANPDAPPLDPELMAELESGSTPVVFSVAFPPTRGTILGQLGPPGPCELLAVHWTSPPSNERRGIVLLVLGLFVVLAAGTALAIFVVIRPLLRRIDRLARHAETVGEDSFVPIDEPGHHDNDNDDALGRVGRQLALSHDRIVSTSASLQRHARALEEHLENVAHDVRTPLAALQLRLEGLLGEAEPSVREHLTASIEDVVYMAQLTENLRLASRLEHGLDRSAHERESDLGEILRRVVARFATLGELRAVKVRGSWPNAPVLVRCDPAAAEQALANLAHNAVLHADSEVTLALDRVGDTDDSFELVVVDDGPGVARQNLPRLVERRFREDRARSRGPRGSGLGLAIVAEVCDRFGWTVAFDTLDPPGLEVVIRGPSQSHS